MAVQVNTELLFTYWNVGKIIVEHEQKNKDRAEYEGVLSCISNLPDSVWQIELVALLRAINNFRPGHTKFL